MTYFAHPVVTYAFTRQGRTETESIWDQKKQKYVTRVRRTRPQEFTTTSGWTRMSLAYEVVDGKVQWGVAFTAPEDQFVRAVGRAKATGDMLKYRKTLDMLVTVPTDSSEILKAVTKAAVEQQYDGKPGWLRDVAEVTSRSHLLWDKFGLYKLEELDVSQQTMTLLESLIK